MMTPRPFRRAVALFISIEVAISPVLVPVLQAQGQSPPLAERVARARTELSERFAAALAGLPTEREALSRDIAASAPPSPELSGAWKAYEELDLAYVDLGSRLVSSPPADLARLLRGLAPRFGVPASDAELLIQRWLQLQTRLQEHRVAWRDGRFLKAGGSPFTKEEWLAFLGRGPKLSPAAERDFLERNKRLADIHQLAQGKRYDEAAAAFDALLKDFSGRGDLLEQGFGSLPLETTLSLMSETQRLLPKEHQARVQERLGAVDSQLKAIASRKIAVPAPGEKGGADLGSATEARLKLSFYAALSALPMTSDWAKERFFAISSAEIFRDNPNVAEKEVRTVGPDGQPRMGFFVRFKDGSSRYESLDGLAVATSADGKTVVTEDRTRGSFKKTVGGRDILSYEPDPATGKISGRFRGTFFQAEKGELLIVTPDALKLLVAKGVDKEGKPIVDRWYGVKENGFYLPGNLGSVRKTWSPGNLHTDILLDPGMLKAAGGKAPDLSGIPAEYLTKARREAFERFLGDLPQFGGLFEASIKQDTSKYKSGGKELTQTNWVEALYIRDGQLTIVLGEGLSVSGEAKARPPSTGNRLVAVFEAEGGAEALKAFIFMGESVFQWKFNPAFDKMEDFRTDAEAKVARGEVVFVLSRKYARKAGRWEITENHPAQLKQWTKWDTVKAYGSGALSGLGDAVGVVFSPFQTALYGIEGTIWLTGGAIVSAADRESGAAGFAKVQGVYTLRQAKFNEWLGQGTKGNEMILETYGSAREVLNEVTRHDLDNFLDGEIEKNRRRRYGELWRFHKDDPINTQDRAQMAAQVFGLANMPGQFMQAGAESWQRGDKAAAVLNYAAGGFVIAGEAYVEGLGFGLAAAPFKVAAVSARTGVAAEQVTAAMVRAGTKGVRLTAAEARAVGAMKALNRAELAVFLAPPGVGMAGNFAGWVDAWRRGDSKAMTENFNGFYANAAGFGALGIGLIQARVSSFAAARRAAAEPPPKIVVVDVKPVEPAPKGKLSGRPARINPKDVPENIRALTRQNQAAETLAKNGYEVVQNGERAGADYSINGRPGYDCYAPETPRTRNIWDFVREKVIDKKQADGVVLVMNDSPVTNAQLAKQFAEWPIKGLRDIILIRDGKVIEFIKDGKVLLDVPVEPKAIDPVKPPEPVNPRAPVKPPEPATSANPVDWIKDAASKATPEAVKGDPLLMRTLLKDGMGAMGGAKSPALLQGKTAYQRGDAATIAKLQGRLNGELLKAAEAFAKSKGLTGSDFVSNGTTLDSLLGMFYSGGIEASSSYAGMKGESAHFWGAPGFKGGASYGATRALSRGKPGVLILMRNAADPIKVVQGELLNRRPELGKDFAAVIITDGANTVVLQKPQLEALGRAGENWKQYVKDQAYKQGKMGPFNEWQAWGEKLLPKER